MPAETKIEFIEKLSNTGLSVVEATAFVSPKWIPQMKDHASVFNGIKSLSTSVNFPVFVPNLKGLNDAIEVGAKEVAVFTTVSETFCKKNVNCTIAQSLERVQEILSVALKNNLKVRGYVRCFIEVAFSQKGYSFLDMFPVVLVVLMKASFHHIKLPN